LEVDLLQELEHKNITKPQLFRIVEADFDLLPELLKGTSSPSAAVRYGCGKVLMDLSEKYPGKLYPYLDTFVKLLGSRYRILTWNSMAIIANLTTVDRERKFDSILDKYYSFLDSGYMVTVANVVGNSAKIAVAKPYLADRIAVALLKVQELQVTPHLTEECKLVIAEHAIQTFGTIFNLTSNKSSLLAFAQKYENSSRSSLRKQAQNFLKKWQ
jgi:hypothetical protein